MREREIDKGKKKKKLYFLKKVMLKTKATLKTMEKLFATTMAITYIFNFIYNFILNCKLASQHIYLFNKH